MWHVISRTGNDVVISITNCYIVTCIVAVGNSNGHDSYPVSPAISLTHLYNELQEYTVQHGVGSTSVPLLYRPCVSSVFSSRAYSAAAPVVWNSLDANARLAHP